MKAMRHALCAFVLGTAFSTSAAFSFEPGDAAAGEKAFRKCAACHQIGEDAKHRTGPVLNGIYGASIASREGFKYSKALDDLRMSDAIWSAELLNQFLANPRKFAPRNRMTFPGVKSEEERADLIAYLALFSEAAAASDAFTVSDDVLALEGDVEYGEYLASECTTCHQTSGANDGIPAIVGLQAEQFVTAMHAYREKYRDNEVMQLVAGRLGNEEIAALAAYFKDLE